MPQSALKPYPWRRLPRLVLRIRYGQAEQAHKTMDALLDEFDQEHDRRLGPRKLRCAMVMSYCTRGARLGGAPSELVIDENLQGIETLWRRRSWTAVRRFMHDYLDQALQHVMPNRQTRITRLIGRMQRELLEDPPRTKTLQQYARSAGLHPDYLSRQFKKRVGQTFCEIRQQGRMARARHLLASSDIKVQTVARRVGMNDPCQFIRNFKKEMGQTPAQYRLLCGQKSR